MKSVKIPDNMNPYKVRVNGVLYEYPAGVEMEVPDKVAEIIEQTSRHHKEPVSVGVPILDTDKWMKAENPEGSGSFSLNRKADTAIGEYSFAGGKDCEASGKYSFAYGYNCTASRDYSSATGRETVASGLYSHAEGVGCVATVASCHAEGRYTSAKANMAHAEGEFTGAYGECQHVQGRYNIVDTESRYAHIVGNGDETARSNAHTLDWEGNAWFAGDVYVGSHEDAGSKKLATESYVQDAVAAGRDGSSYVVHVPGSDFTTGEDGPVTIRLSESYDNFVPIIAKGGSVWLDLSQMPELAGQGVGLYQAPVIMAGYATEAGGFMMVSTDFLSGRTIQVMCPNGTWQPPGTTTEVAE